MRNDGDLQYVQPVSPHAHGPDAVARMILAGFDRHYALFRYSAQRAKALFESANWHGIQQLSRERIEYYDIRVRECAASLAQALRDTAPAQATPGLALAHEQIEFWQATKTCYIGLLASHRQPACAETFFNSVSCRILHRNYFNNDFLFVRPAVATDYIDGELPAYRSYYPLTQGLLPSLTQMVADFGLACPYLDLPADVRRLARRGLRHLHEALPRDLGRRLAADCQIQVLNSLFFRNKGAYIVGRLINQTVIHPFAVALLQTPSGHVQFDALLHTSDDLSTLFSFTRAYFLVDMEAPAAYVEFLASLFPRKPKAEIYTTLGLQKQGKTLFYRDFLHHLSHSSDAFDAAPGIHGMVMTVFTLPSYPYVFKLIRDHIHKEGMDEATVRRKYLMVKKHDRVGRMADTWEYSQVALPRSRFSARLLASLRTDVPSLLEETGDLVVLKHVYIERRMTPLNLFLVNAPDAALDAAIQQYGQAIRELAAANIFPGDMLYKNFGLTRLGRVVFYDYDEIERMTDMQFRRIPPAPNEEAELSGEPWYPVGAHDVFPEEFAHFLLGNPRVRAAFLKYHAPLLEAQWWQECRTRAAQGHIEDIYPYPPARRLQTRGLPVQDPSVSPHIR
ncbi:MAG TPA: bifunctional isocitrate dehydrogenase kinase/phosphatase [Castellaniella sp.]|uniref:bifunctional isocitrate dehydrogenase kinase/phosphatase n=1 Tax=Castellaniella sp. TaxID=1955812 RepID=UPI002EE07C16